MVAFGVTHFEATLQTKGEGETKISRTSESDNPFHNNKIHNTDTISEDMPQIFYNKNKEKHFLTKMDTDGANKDQCELTESEEIIKDSKLNTDEASTVKAAYVKNIKVSLPLQIKEDETKENSTVEGTHGELHSQQDDVGSAQGSNLTDNIDSSVENRTDCAENTNVLTERHDTLDFGDTRSQHQTRKIDTNTQKDEAKFLQKAISENGNDTNQMCAGINNTVMTINHNDLIQCIEETDEKDECDQSNDGLKASSSNDKEENKGSVTNFYLKQVTTSPVTTSTYSRYSRNTPLPKPSVANTGNKQAGHSPSHRKEGKIKVTNDISWERVKSLAL